MADPPVHGDTRDGEPEGTRDHDSDRQPESATSKDEEKETPPAEAAPEPNAKQPQPGPPGGPPPNGGLTAWLQVVGSWMLFFNTWVSISRRGLLLLIHVALESYTNSRQGILNTFGVFQTYYESGELFSTSSSNISWIGSIQALMVLLVGAVVGPVYDNGYFRYLLVFGSFFIVFGFMMLSLCNEFWQCLLAQGFCVGIGGGALFVPAVAIMPTYFTTKLGLALGLAASGSSMGGIIYPIMFYRLLDEVGFGWAVRIFLHCLLAIGMMH